MITVSVVLLLLALVCFIAAAGGYPPGIQIGWLGAAFLALMLLIQALTGR